MLDHLIVGYLKSLGESASVQINTDGKAIVRVELQKGEHMAVQDFIRRVNAYYGEVVL